MSFSKRSLQAEGECRYSIPPQFTANKVEIVRWRRVVWGGIELHSPGKFGGLQSYRRSDSP